LPKTKNFLVSFEIFQEIQKDKSINKSEIQNHYNYYKQKSEKEKSREFFTEYKNENWFKNKYDIERKMAINNHLIAQCQELSNYFEECLKSGKFQKLNLKHEEIEENFLKDDFIEVENFINIKIFVKTFY